MPPGDPLLPYGEGEYGIAANVGETDRFLRMGALSWIVGGTGGCGAEKFQWLSRTRSGHLVVKWAPITRFTNFRAKWIPKHVHDLSGYPNLWYQGDRDTMEDAARRLQIFRDEEAARHPNRRI